MAPGNISLRVNPMLERFLLLLLLFIFFLISPTKTFAKDNSFITIVNPVRISSYNKTPGTSLSAEYSEISKRNLPATWLLTYDALKNEDLMKTTESFDDKQEFGVFLEVSSSLATSAGVMYNARDSWHRATSLFLSGYKQEDRRKLIDKVFGAFKKKFGYYPRSVGSWWTDAYSLNYLSGKYHVTSNLSVSDQFALDGYTVWGTYWSTPYYPSKINAAEPANSDSNKIDTVMLRWAPRDPLNGYRSQKESPAMYSLQDYDTIHLPDDYFEKISSFYLNTQTSNQFSNLTLGLESDLNPETFSTIYSKRLDMLMSNIAQFTTMKDFSDWYRNKFKNISPSHFLLTDDFLGSGKKAIWFQNPKYRIGFLYDPYFKVLTIRDLRPYYSNFEEPFFKSPNGQNGLQILLPYVIDTNIEPATEWNLSCGKFESSVGEGEEARLQFEKCQILLQNDSIHITGIKTAPHNMIANPGIRIVIEKDSIIIFPQEKFPVGQQGKTIDNIGFHLPFALIRRLPVFIINFIPFLSGILLAIMVFIIYEGTNHFGKNFLKGFAGAFLIILLLLILSRQELYISQSETDALSYLSRLPQGKVLVYDKDCVKCEFETPQKPAGASGYKKYIEQLSHKKVIESLKLPLAKSLDDFKSEITSSKAKYLYLVKYEDYIEELPYPPESLGLSRIYENANAQIWQVR